MISTLGWLATILFIVMLVPQIITTYKTKTVKGVSLLLYVIFLTANIIALVYAMLIHQWPLILKYAISILIAVFYIALFLQTKYKGTQDDTD
jgi:MtN3 and saliva related transmembrane protein